MVEYSTLVFELINYTGPYSVPIVSSLCNEAGSRTYTINNRVTAGLFRPARSLHLSMQLPQTLILQSPIGRLSLISPPPEGDEEATVALRTHPKVLEHLKILPDRLTVEDVTTRAKQRLADPRLLDFSAYLTKGADGKRELIGVAGYFNLDTVNQSCEVGILVRPDLHGKQYATEILYVVLHHIFNTEKLHRITFETASSNGAMRGWLERTAGARLECQRRDAWRINDGTFVDVAGYAMLADEWHDKVEPRLRKRLEMGVDSKEKSN